MGKSLSEVKRFYDDIKEGAEQKGFFDENNATVKDMNKNKSGNDKDSMLKDKFDENGKALAKIQEAVAKAVEALMALFGRSKAKAATP